ncbi:hypothetical protein [Nocardiopsis sp. CNR-923]|nr:hypothetical protein [Nocardiopsis sp. CNR-923]
MLALLEREARVARGRLAVERTSVPGAGLDADEIGAVVRAARGVTTGSPS